MCNLGEKAEFQTPPKLCPPKLLKIYLVIMRRNGPNIHESALINIFLKSCMFLILWKKPGPERSCVSENRPFLLKISLSSQK